ncbi:hypothetical protein ACLJYM_14400 [Rhizobium giardinii]|uniref:hypothetical protein n=1 Tax=Rhizobium giardinii TaxID=56731 RepID=UPI0039DFA3BC
MIIKLSPQRRDDTISVSVVGDTLTINGEEFDFGPLPEGATLPYGSISSEWFAGPVSREGGQIVATLVLPHAAGASENVTFPADVVVTTDGEVSLPVDHNAPPEPPEIVDDVEQETETDGD